MKADVSIVLLRLGSLLILCGLVFACERNDVVEAPVINEQPAPEPASQPDARQTVVEAPGKIRPRQIDTRITPDMVKDLRFDTTPDDVVLEVEEHPLNTHPLGNTRISVTPKFFLKEDVKITEDRLDSIEGGAVEVEVKFD